MRCVELMMTWCHTYTKTCQDCVMADVVHHGPFYSVCQSIFYVFAFRQKEIFETKAGIHLSTYSMYFTPPLTLVANLDLPLSGCHPSIWEFCLLHISESKWGKDKGGKVVSSMSYGHISSYLCVKLCNRAGTGNLFFQSTWMQMVTFLCQRRSKSISPIKFAYSLLHTQVSVLIKPSCNKCFMSIKSCIKSVNILLNILF